MSTTLHDAVFYQVLAQALNKANPSGLPSNLTLQGIAMPTETITVQTVIQATTTQLGYAYGSGQRVVANAGAGTYAFTQPYGAAWLVRLFAQIPSGSSVSLSAAIGGGTSQPITMLDPAQTLGYGDLFRWSPAIALGPVGIGPWGTPSGWPDAAATWLGPVEGSTGNVPVGGSLLRKWVCNPSKQTITVSLAADNQANVFIDGTLIVQSSTYASTTQGSVLLASGWHLVAISALNYGSAPNPTGVLLSLADPQGNVLEDGSTDSRVGATWETTGFLGGTWTTVNSASDLAYQWGVIPASLMTSESVSLTVSTTGLPRVHAIDCYTIAPWRWNQGALYNNPGTVGWAIAAMWPMAPLAVDHEPPAVVPPVRVTQSVG